MAFSAEVKESVLVKSRRRCCICHEFAGRPIEVHHIVPESEGGSNVIDNAIALCLRCHSEAGHYNPKHPIGNKYSAEELRRHRDAWWQWCKQNPFAPLPDDPIIVSPHVMELRTGKWGQKLQLKIRNNSEYFLYQVSILISTDSDAALFDRIHIDWKKEHDEGIQVGSYSVSTTCLRFDGTNDQNRQVILLLLSGIEPQQIQRFALKNTAQYESIESSSLSVSIQVISYSEEPSEMLFQEGQQEKIAVSFQLPISLKLHGISFKFL